MSTAFSISRSSRQAISVSFLLICCDVFVPDIPRLGTPRYAINSTSPSHHLYFDCRFESPKHQLCSSTLFTLHYFVFAANLLIFLTVALFLDHGSPQKSITLLNRLHILLSTDKSITSIVAMKQTFVAASLLAVGATAQNTTSTRTVYYNTCTTSGGIVTATDIETYCPPCEAAGMTTFAGGSLTTYVTQYSQVCPTGLEEATYTVTEPYPSTGLARGSGYIPQGFTVSTVPCSVCKAGQSQYAQTTPGPALASALATPAAAPAVPTSPAGSGSAAPPAAAPVAPGTPPASAPNSAAAPGAAAPAENGAAAPAGSGAGSPASAPNAAAAPGAAAPAENGAAAPAGSGAGSPANAPNAAAPAENGAAAPAGSASEAPAPYPLPSQAGQVATANGAPGSSGNSTVPFTGAASQLSTVDISSFIAALTALITGFVFVL